jgi:hypothetical protein
MIKQSEMKRHVRYLDRVDLADTMRPVVMMMMMMMML